jgi:hypothetical protein
MARCVVRLRFDLLETSHAPSGCAGFPPPYAGLAGSAFGNAADRDPVVTPPDRSGHHEGIAILAEDDKLDSARAAGFSWIRVRRRRKAGISGGVHSHGGHRRRRRFGIDSAARISRNNLSRP